MSIGYLLGQLPACRSAGRGQLVIRLIDNKEAIIKNRFLNILLIFILLITSLYFSVPEKALAADSWSTGASGGTARERHKSIYYNGKIYSWAGYNGTNLNTLDIYDIASDSWSTGLTGGTARRHFGSIMYDGKMYSWGGNNGIGGYLNTLDIYDTGYHPNPEFNNLPGDTVPINLTEGQVVTTPTYTIEVYPTSPNEIEKVEFYIDNVLIDTDYTADENGVYSTIWDTTLYHSDIRVVAYDPFGRTTELTRTVTVDNGSNNNNTSTTVTELPATGMNAVKFSIFNFKFLMNFQ